MCVHYHYTLDLEEHFVFIFGVTRTKWVTFGDDSNLDTDSEPVF